MSNTDSFSLSFDLYQFTMAYTYWKTNSHNDIATFNLYFRKAPFGGTFAILGGISEAVEFVSNFHFSEKDIEDLKSLCAKMQFNYENEFFDYLASLNSSHLAMDVIEEGSVVFPNIPLVQITGPIVLAQLIETQLLYLIGHPTLVATNARRIRQAVSPEQKLFEFGLRRSQGLSGGINASKYSWIGGFDGTSNISAGIKYDIPVIGTHAHSYVMSWTGLNQVPDNLVLASKSNPNIFTDNFKQFIFEINGISEQNLKTNLAELSAFIMYAWSQPNNFLALIDTYDVVLSGLVNYCMVANALIKLGYAPKGVRIDSGDLSWLSVQTRKYFNAQMTKYPQYAQAYYNMAIVISNDLDENVIKALREEGCDVNTFGVGTDISSSKRSPALGVVYKLVAINGIPRIKISEDVGKTTIPGKKYIYRLYNHEGLAILDLMTTKPAKPGLSDLIDEQNQIECIDPKNPLQRVKVQYHTHQELLVSALDSNGKPQINTSSYVSKSRCSEQICTIRPDHLRSLNPTPYKISVSVEYMELIQKLFDKEKVSKTL